mgnify:CR=1 FL=1
MRKYTHFERANYRSCPCRRRRTGATTRPIVFHFVDDGNSLTLPCQPTLVSPRAASIAAAPLPPHIVLAATIAPRAPAPAPGPTVPSVKRPKGERQTWTALAAAAGVLAGGGRCAATHGGCATPSPRPPGPRRPQDAQAACHKTKKGGKKKKKKKEERKEKKRRR